MALRLLLRLLLIAIMPCAVRSDAAPASLDQLWRRAMMLYDQKQWGASAAVLQQLASQQRFPNASVEAALAAAYHQTDHLHLAQVHYERALAVRPNHAATLVNAGFLYGETHQHRFAVTCFQRAIEVDATQAPRVLHALALSYHYLGDYTTADALYNQVPRTAHSAQYHYDRAVTLERLGNVVAAANAYNTALLLDQEFAVAWHNIAALHQQYGNAIDSIRNYKRVLAIRSAAPSVQLMATINLAIAYEMTDDVQSALRWYDRARALANATAEPLDTVVSLQVHVARAKRTACIWDDYEDAEELLLHQVAHEQLGKGQRPGLLPFDTLLLAMDPLLRLAIARFHADEIATATAAMFANASPAPMTGSSRGARLGVGYVSYDFNDHPTAHLLEGVFAAHDRTTIDAVAFGYGKDDGSEFRQRLVAVVDEFVNLAGVATDACVLEIKARQLDILMDAQGHTRGGRAHITAIRPAPVVVNYLVYPGTSGASYTDYVVADRHVAPPEATATHFSEKLVLLPHSYQVNYYPRAVVPLGRASLWEAEEKKNGFTFVNFNKIDKLEPAAFSLWMAILRRVPQSRLVLLNPVKDVDVDASTRRRQDGATTTGDEIVRSLRREAAANGIVPSRIAFVPRVTKRDHLRRHRQGGLFLDTLVYGAHSTASDALYAGLPVLTLAGDAFAGRVGVSLLHNVQLPELVTHSRKEFEDLAVAIATEPEALLRRLHSKLRTPNDRVPLLFRTHDHVASLEAAQRVMATLHRRATRSYATTNATARTAHIIVVD